MEKENIVFTESTLKIPTAKKCPQCGWETNNGGFVCDFPDFKGDFCLKCYAINVTKGVPLLEEL